MLPSYRRAFNQNWRPELYEQVLAMCAAGARAPLEFRISETPCFFPAALMDQIVATGADLTHQLLNNSSFLAASETAVPERFRVPHCSAHPHFMTVDFGLVRDGDSLVPRLVELQAFPSIFAFQSLLASAYLQVFHLPPDLPIYLGGHTDVSYWRMLHQVILGNHAPETVVLLEIEPEQQKTLPDFHVHEDKLGIRTVDIAKVKKRGRRLFYTHEGQEIPIERIYNRAIVDELERKKIALPFDYRDDLDVEWAGHPNWYFRISKFAIPWLQHVSVPRAIFLSDLDRPAMRELLPKERENWILKPLFSFAGKGIQFAPSDAELAEIPAAQRHLYLLQERAHFEPVIDTPHGLTQAEIRVMYCWPDDGTLTPMICLVRMGRGKMMGVDHNRNQEWVGASAGFIVPEGDLS